MTRTMMTTDHNLNKTLHDLRDNLATRGHELDAGQLESLLDALHQLYTSTKNLNTELQSLVKHSSRVCSRRPTLYVIK